MPFFWEGRHPLSRELDLKFLHCTTRQHFNSGKDLIHKKGHQNLYEVVADTAIEIWTSKLKKYIYIYLIRVEKMNKKWIKLKNLNETIKMKKWKWKRKMKKWKWINITQERSARTEASVVDHEAHPPPPPLHLPPHPCHLLILRQVTLHAMQAARSPFRKALRCFLKLKQISSLNKYLI